MNEREGGMKEEWEEGKEHGCEGRRGGIRDESKERRKYEGENAEGEGGREILRERGR